MMFFSREDAGRQLANHLRDEGVEADWVLGLPRGGVVVAAEVARGLRAPLAVMVVRKVGHPRQREFAVGAMAEAGVVILNQSVIARARVMPAELEEVVAEERERMEEYERKFHPEPPPELRGKRVLIIDDGLATGATAEAAVLSARKREARQVLLAVPVASDSAFERLSRLADRVYALLVDPAFDAVGRYYTRFSQTTDAEVMERLRAQSPGVAR